MKAVSNYIYFTESKAKEDNRVPGVSSFNIEYAKQKIIDKFFATAKAKFIAENGAAVASADSSDLKSIYNAMTSGDLGGELVNELNSMFEQNSSTGAEINKIFTGAGLMKDIDFSLEGRPIPQTSADIASELLTRINNKLQKAIDELTEKKEYYLAKQLFNVAGGGRQKGVTLPSGLNWKRITKGDFSLLDGKVDASMKRLKEIMTQLRQIKSKKAGFDSFKNSEGKEYTPRGFALAAVGALSNIGGELYEMMVVHSANVVAYKAKEGIIRPANHVFSSLLPPGSTIRFDPRLDNNNAAQHIADNMVKGDLSIHYNINGFSFTAVGSIKNRQSERVQLGQELKLKDLHGGYSLGRMIEDAYSLEGYSVSEVETYEQYAAFVLDQPGGHEFILSEGNELHTAWRKMREYGKYAALLTQLTGSGDFNIHDFADIMIVNNKVLPMYKILEIASVNLENPSIVQFSGPGANYEFGTMRSDVCKSFGGKKKAIDAGADNAETRSNSALNRINQIYEKRVNMTLNMLKIMTMM